ncbi:MAG TPA: hypothetical protein VFT12_07865 [Thermoanaerobaculia bacterium]|nr:hypothetical protein [Thermoanaerobaculia bacterium]
MSEDARVSEASRIAVIPRRQFLVLGSSALIGAMATSLSARAVRAVAKAPQLEPKLSLGFIEGNAATLLPSGASARILPAEQISGMQTPAASLRMAIHGLSGDQALRQLGVTSIGIDVLIDAAGVHDGPVPFHAWSHSIRHRVQGTSSSTAFTIPGGVREPVTLSVVPGGGSALGAAEITLHAGGDGGVYRLREGIYFLAIQPADATAAPDWWSIRAVGTDERRIPALVTGIDQPVAFPYVVLTVSREAEPTPV